jgi:diphthamide synthase (EF-2-diphthine--ammonia ligase)
MTKLTGAALDRAVANAMGLKSVNNCEQWGKEMIEEDDDIQDYKRPWVGLTDEEIQDAIYEGNLLDDYPQKFVAIIEKKLKEKNT